MNNTVINVKRDAYFDNVKFILIIIVVFSHIIEPLRSRFPEIYSIYLLIYFFHMPAFIFLSGYLIKYSKHKLSMISKVFVPYLIFQTAHYLLDIYIRNETHDLQFTTPDWTLWFLMSLLAWYIITPYFVRFKYPLIMSIILALLISYDKSVGTYLSLSRSIVFYPFYLFGFFINKEQLLSVRKNKIVMILFLLISIIVIILLFTRYSDFDDNWLFGRHPYEKLTLNLKLAWLKRLIIMLISTIMLLTFFNLIPSKRYSFTKFGQRTLDVYLIHSLILQYLKITSFYNYFGELYKVIFLLIISIVIVLIFSSSLVNLQPLIYPNLKLIYGDEDAYFNRKIK